MQVAVSTRGRVAINVQHVRAGSDDFVVEPMAQKAEPMVNAGVAGAIGGHLAIPISARRVLSRVRSISAKT